MPWALVLFVGGLLAREPRPLGVHIDGRMSVRGIADDAAKLEAGPSGWTVPVEMPGDGGRCRAELKDVSPIPGHLLKWIEALDNRTPRTQLTLEPARYFASHTYRLSIRCGLRELQHAYLHLVGAPAEVRPVRFQIQGDSRADDSGEILSVPKGSL